MPMILYCLHGIVLSLLMTDQPFCIAIVSTLNRQKSHVFFQNWCMPWLGACLKPAVATTWRASRSTLPSPHLSPFRCTPRWPVVTRHEQHLFCYMRMFTSAVALDIGFLSFALHITCWWSCCKPTPDYVCATCFCRKIGIFNLIYSPVLLTNAIFVPRVCLFYVACMMLKPNQSCYVLAPTKAFISMTFLRKYTCIYIYICIERGKIFSKKEVRAMEVGPSDLFFTGDGTGELKVWKWSTNKMPVSWFHDTRTNSCTI